MTTKTILITAVCALTGMSMLRAADTVEAVVVQPATVGLEHPFYQDKPYPAWSQMTPQKALADAREGIRLAYERLDAISKVKPEEATFENTFLALAYSSVEMDQTMG